MEIFKVICFDFWCLLRNLINIKSCISVKSIILVECADPTWPRNGIAGAAFSKFCYCHHHRILSSNGPLAMAWLDILIASNPFLGWLASGEIFTRSPSVLKFTKIAVKNYQKLEISYKEWSWHYISAGPIENLTGFRIWLDAYWRTIAKKIFGRLRLSLAGWWCIVEIILILVSSFASAQETPSFFHHTLFSFN